MVKKSETKIIIKGCLRYMYEPLYSNLHVGTLTNVEEEFRHL